MLLLMQLRMLQEAIRREEDFLAEERRREIQARAEEDEEAKCAYYEAKQNQREARLQQVRLELWSVLYRSWDPGMLPQSTAVRVIIIQLCCWVCFRLAAARSHTPLATACICICQALLGRRGGDCLGAQ